MLDGVPVVAMHRNMTWNTTDGLRIDTGMYLTGMEQACGKTATAIGKPAAEDSWRPPTASVSIHSRWS